MGRFGRIVAPLAALLLFAPPLVLAQGGGDGFPGSDPSNPRVGTPDDPKFDRCEPDGPDPPSGECDSYFEEDYRLFGFSPDSANEAPLLPHEQAATSYDDCSQLDAQGRAVNQALGDPECAQIAGIRADSAWTYSIGSPKVAIAILDTGIEWQNEELVDKLHLNRAELPRPLADRDKALRGSKPCADYATADDANGDGAFSVSDYACDSRGWPSTAGTASPTPCSTLPI